MTTEYVYPSSVEEAVGLLSAYGGEAQILAGGTDLLPDLRKGKKAPRCLVDITRIPELDRICIRGDQVEVGAATTFVTLKEHPFLRQQVPALAEAASSVGAIAIQTVATWAGNLVQAMPAADGAIVALALEAEAHVVHAVGAEWRPVESLFVGPGRSAVDSTCELITHLRFPLPADPWGAAWRRIGRRASLVLPILNCAVKLVLNGDRIQRAVIALGPVDVRPFRARSAEVFLVGHSAEPAVLAQAAEIAGGESNPRTSILRASRAYRLAIIPALVRDALGVAAVRAGERSGPVIELTRS